MIDRAGRGKVVADGVPAACGLAWDERLTDYHFGPGHPMAPLRVELTMRLAHEFGLWDWPGVIVAARTRPPARTCRW